MVLPLLPQSINNRSTLIMIKVQCTAFEQTILSKSRGVVETGYKHHTLEALAISILIDIIDILWRAHVHRYMIYKQVFREQCMSDGQFQSNLHACPSGMQASDGCLASAPASLRDRLWLPLRSRQHADNSMARKLG